MLVLSRKPGEDIVIPELNIRIRVLESRSSRVRIGVEAPEDIRIERGEMTAKTVTKVSKVRPARKEADYSVA